MTPGRGAAPAAEKPHLLFLCHRIPYPPDKGDKIRSHQWLTALAASFRVHLAAFVDDPADWAHRNRLAALCHRLLLLPLHPLVGRVRSLIGLLTGEPLSLPYYRDPRLRRWVGRTMRTHDVRHLLVYSSAMAQYATPGRAGVDPRADFSQTRRVIDFVDVDADKWRQYAQEMRGPMRWVYGREATRLAAFDRAVARDFDLCLFVSAAEAAWFRECGGADGGTLDHVPNGVDSAYFDPGLGAESPYPAGVRPVLFTGAMDYWSNQDAVTWLAREVMPRVRAKLPDAVFYIVGSRPAAGVTALAGEGVRVTGRVPDVRPYLRHAEAVVAPMRIARGIQNKVLEAMAMARPVVVTSKALEGIAARDGEHLLVADEAGAFAGRLEFVLGGGHPGMGAAARALMVRDYAWADSRRRLVELVSGAGA